MPAPSLAVALTCHNRKEKTLSALHALSKQVGTHFHVRVFLTDDGSTDGTSAAVGSAFPDATILSGNGSLFWAGGMRLAIDAAMKTGPDYYLWLNDDTELAPSALEILRACTRVEADAIIVGTASDPTTGEATYGGLRRVSKRRLRLKLLRESGELRSCDTFNGNIVLVPASAVDKLGNLDSSFTHGIADIDYGLRASRLGIPQLVAPGFLGTCAQNTLEGTWVDPSLTRLERLSRLNSPKGLPVAQWARFTRRHGGVLWPLIWASPYVRALAGRSF